MNDTELSLDMLLQETLAMSEYLRSNNSSAPVQTTFLDDEPAVLEEALDADYLYDLSDSTVPDHEEQAIPDFSAQVVALPESCGVIYKIDNALSTFCVRGFSVSNIREAMAELSVKDCSKRLLLKLQADSGLDAVHFFETKSFELAEAIREQVINRRFPHQEDSLCNLSDPGFSWWMNVGHEGEEGRFEIFFRSHGINRAEKYIQLGPIGDGSIAALRMNQARTLLRSSFPIAEFSCDDKSFTVATSKPDHSSFISFKNIFLHGTNQTELENFPDNGTGRTLFYYFHELAVVRKFWIEVKSKLG